MELNTIKEYLNTGTGTEGSLLIEKKIHDLLIPEVEKAIIPRTEAASYIGPAQIPGSSYDFNLEAENAMDVRLVAEGGEIALDNDEYTSINIKPLKYGVQIRITSEMMEDSKFNIFDMNIVKAGKRLGENENSLVIAQLDTAANTVSGGAQASAANITRAMQYLEDSDYQPTTLFVGAEFVKDLRDIDTFVEANKVGNTDFLRTGFLGIIYGLNVQRVSTNAGMTTTTAYVTDRTQAYALAEKRTVTVETFRVETNDMDSVTITQRVAAKALRTNAMAKITTS